MVDSRRDLIASDRQCPFQCEYCFAKLNQYRNVSDSLSGAWTGSTRADAYRIIYPSCDSEFVISEKYFSELLKKIDETKDRVVIDFSTKRKLTKNDLTQLAKVQELLLLKDSSLKVSISFSNKNEISTIEGGTASYEDRLDNARNLCNLGIPVSATIKPILPFVDVSEYYEIIDGCSQSLDHFLVGGLYVDPTSVFGKNILKDFPDYATRRRVSWLPGEVFWDYVEDPIQVSKVSQYAVSRGAKCFDSDIELVDSLIWGKCVEHY